jgi:glycosyltransferase involved in cell wall biosynthesis
VKEKSKNISVVFRKPFDGQFSIENVFNPIFRYLKTNTNSNISYWIAPEFSRGLIARIRIMRILTKVQADIYHNTGDINFAHIFLNSKKVILTIHDCEFINRSKGLKKLILKLFWLTLPIARANKVTVISKSTKDEVLSYLKYNPHKIVIIPNPIRGEYTYSPKMFNTNKPTILQVGTKKNKNILRLIEAIQEINCHLRIIGKLTDVQKEKLEKHNIQYSNDYNISNQQMLEEYQNTDILILVSTEEGFGLPIIEANAIGRIVITSNISSMPEVAGEAAYLVNPYDIQSIRNGIEEVIRDKPLRENLIEYGLKNARKYSVENIASKYLELYKQILEQ